MNIRYLLLITLICTNFLLQGAAQKEYIHNYQLHNYSVESALFDYSYDHYDYFPPLDEYHYFHYSIPVEARTQRFKEDFLLFCKACAKNNVALIKRMIQKYLPTPQLLEELLNMKKSDELSPLSTAIENQHLFATQMLLAAGANINIHYHRGKEPPILQILCYRKPKNRKETTALFNLLLFNEADFLYIDPKNYQTALHHAVTFEHLPLVQMLLASGIDPNISDIFNRTPLHLLFEEEIKNRQHFLSIFNTLLLAGANPFSKSSSEKKTIFEHALERCDLEVCKLLYNYVEHCNDTKIFLQRLYTHLNIKKSDQIYRFQAKLYCFMQSIADKDKNSLIKQLKEFMLTHIDNAYPDYQEKIEQFLNISDEKEQAESLKIKNMFAFERVRLKEFIDQYPY